MIRYLHVQIDDNLVSLMERLSFHLMEMGIKVDVAEANDESVTYRLTHADPLPPEEEE
jgi:hypothetical protein